MPLGAWILCPETEMRSAPRLFAVKGSFMKPWTASQWRSAWEPAFLSARETPAMSVTAPVSLLTSMSETSFVSGRSAPRTAETGTAPVSSGASRVTSQPRRSSSSRARRTASCSAWELMTWPPLAEAARAPERMAQLSASEPQEVKTTSPGLQPRQSASSRRAESRSFFASRPRAWVELGLPNCPVITL